jgi:hypothetical protein
MAGITKIANKTSGQDNEIYIDTTTGILKNAYGGVQKTLVELTAEQTLTNKTLTSPTITTPTITGVLTEELLTNGIDNDGASIATNEIIGKDSDGTSNLRLKAGSDGSLILHSADNTEWAELNDTGMTIAQQSVISVPNGDNGDSYKYFKDSCGIVHVRITFGTSTISPSQIGNAELPTGYRPTVDLFYNYIHAIDATAYYTISDAGAIYINRNASLAGKSVEVSFYAG